LPSSDQLKCLPQPAVALYHGIDDDHGIALSKQQQEQCYFSKPKLD
jgi:hypothetical protein